MVRITLNVNSRQGARGNPEHNAGKETTHAIGEAMSTFTSPRTLLLYYS